MIKDRNQPIQILHVVGGMNRGGVETWLMHVLRHMDSSLFHHDFLVHTNQRCQYDEEIEGLGSRILRCSFPHQPQIYYRKFKDILQNQGPYDIVHSHVHFYSGFTLFIAKQSNIQGRISHSHNDTRLLQSRASFFRRIYLMLMKRLINKCATHGLACSQSAATALFGPHWSEDKRWRLLYYGIDLTPFEIPIDKHELRKELNIPAEVFVIGHVGRFVEQKNHSYLLDICHEFCKRQPNCYILLIGDGPLRSAIENKARDLGMGKKIIFAGVRDDIPSLMRVAMDIFLFPSLFEGLGLVLIEAQAAGLPCIISDLIPSEVDLVKPLIHRLSLNDPPSMWAETILSIKNHEKIFGKNLGYKIIYDSQFNINNSINHLEKIYLSCMI